MYSNNFTQGRKSGVLFVSESYSLRFSGGKKQHRGMSLALSGTPGEAWQKKAVWLKQLTHGQVFITITQQQVETLQRGASWVGR